MTRVTTIQTHEHGKRRTIGEQYDVSERQAKQLSDKGLVIIDEGEPSAENPITGAGAQSSASPAGPASPSQTETPSGDGEPTTGEPSEPTPSTEPQPSTEAEPAAKRTRAATRKPSKRSTAKKAAE